MVFAGNNTGGAFFLLDKLKGEEGREGRKKKKKSTTKQIRTQKLSKMHHSISASTNAEMSSKANARARHTQKMLVLSLGDSLFS